jgi:hypothetical protein
MMTIIVFLLGGPLTAAGGPQPLSIISAVRKPRLRLATLPAKSHTCPD